MRGVQRKVRSVTPNNNFPSLLHSEIQEGNGYTTPQTASKTPLEPIKKQIFRTFPPIDYLDRMLPSPVLVSFILSLYTCPI